MSKSDILKILDKHDEAIRGLEKSTAEMMLIWKIVGAVALVTLGAWFSTLIK